ncbi:MAG TPA: SGNH/GDSL hydrolase family protein, partial [Candidatus Methylacidiphilales bacterium]|nr:SGNH/GDSL hydrolase family protein [Candidatus Methylacidiphilales bacterium]
MSMLVGDFALFDLRAHNGESLNVVFLGGSLTWGAQATDPQLTSYRALTAQRLRDYYPKAHFTFWDAGMGGTNSQLAVFRLQRDVLQHRPDLVFLDLTVDDGPFNVDAPKMASYESLVRRMIMEAGAPVILMLLAVKQDVEIAPPPKLRPRDGAHKEIARVYKTGLGDAVTLIQHRVQQGFGAPDDLWPDPSDVIHPGDLGYEIYAEAAWQGFRQGVEQGKICMTPHKMLHAETYMTWKRRLISSLDPLPEGWKSGPSSRLGLSFDFYMSRWLDNVTIASVGAKPLKLQIGGSMALLFGEETPLSGKFKVLIDGKPASFEHGTGGIYSAYRTGGTAPLVRILAEGLDTKQPHTLEIIPQLDIGQE